jgi:hypothetical protein
MKQITLAGLALMALLMTGSGCATSNRMYQGKPYEGRVQEIPGRLSCIRFDEGGEGVAYHDRENTNLAAICCDSHFRVNEGVDVGVIADHHKSLGAPLDPNANYIGWIFEGEWLNYTVDVKQSGTYQVNAHMSSANTNCAIQFLVNGRNRSGLVPITRATGNVHTWDMYTNIARIKLDAGPQNLTLKFAKGQNGDQNYEYLDFVPVK